MIPEVLRLYAAKPSVYVVGCWRPPDHWEPLWAYLSREKAEERMRVERAAEKDHYQWSARRLFLEDGV